MLMSVFPTSFKTAAVFSRTLTTTSVTDLNKARIAIKELNKNKPPKRPRNASNIYFEERWQDSTMKRQFDGTNLGSLAKMIFTEYRGLSGSEKAKYIRLQQQDKERFSREIKDWYLSMKANSELSAATHEQVEKLAEKYRNLGYM